MLVHRFLVQSHTEVSKREGAMLSVKEVEAHGRHGVIGATIGHGGSGTDRVKCPGPQQQVDGRLDWNSIDDDDTGWWWLIGEDEKKKKTSPPSILPGKWVSSDSEFNNNNKIIDSRYPFTGLHCPVRLFQVISWSLFFWGDLLLLFLYSFYGLF